jgi:RNA 2',3'-cyclic 3'-phosphodiesterase
MRIFTAIPLTKEVKERFTQIAQGKLPVPYVNVTHLHITLNFLGELDTDQVKLVIENWDKNLPVVNKFRIEFDKLVKFHQQIHMTVKDNPALKTLQSSLEKCFIELGFRIHEREYYPHVKLSNLHMDKVMNKHRKIEDFPNQELSELSFDADRIVLYESKLLLHHPHHIELAEYALT